MKQKRFKNVPRTNAHREIKTLFFKQTKTNPTKSNFRFSKSGRKVVARVAARVVDRSVVARVVARVAARVVDRSVVARVVAKLHVAVRVAARVVDHMRGCRTSNTHFEIAIFQIPVLQISIPKLEYFIKISFSNFYFQNFKISKFQISKFPSFQNSQLSIYIFSKFQISNFQIALLESRITDALFRKQRIRYIENNGSVILKITDPLFSNKV